MPPMIPDDAIGPCPYRANIRGTSAEPVAECLLLLRLVPVSDRSLGDVRGEACACCLRSAPPSPNEPNPVVASLVMDLTRRVIARGGADGCDAKEAARIRRWAEDFLDLDPADIDVPYRPKRELDPCHYLGPAIGFRIGRVDGRPGRLAVFRCHHPGHDETTPEGCRGCRDWSEGSRDDLDHAEARLPIPATRCGPSVRQWSVGVTTAPRRRPTLEWTLDGLARAGWDQPRLFVDGSVTIPDRHAHLAVTCRDPHAGAWPNFYLGLAELLLRDPDADAFLMIQDDVEFFDRADLRTYLEEILWPGDRPGPVSLYTSRPDARTEEGWTPHHFPWFLGALAFIFPRDAAERFLADPVVTRHRRDDPIRGLAHVDTVVGGWAFREGTPIVHPTPSLCRHVGHASSLWPLGKAEGPRQEGAYVGDEAAPRRFARLPADFDEAAFPCAGGRAEAYRRAVARGTREMRSRSVVICGIGRDVHAFLPDFAARVERLGKMFGSYRGVFYENDSKDATPAFLRAWSGANPAIRVVCEQRGHPRFPQIRSLERAGLMATYRNTVREMILDRYHRYDHAIVVDMDLAGGWSFDGIAHSFGHDDWDFVGSNGIMLRPPGLDRPIHFDSWAYRESGRDEPPPRGEVNRLAFLRGQPLWPVWSCFGGLGVYRMACLEAAYGGDDCEHVAFHRNQRELGFVRQFLNPSQIVLYDLPEAAKIDR